MGNQDKEERNKQMDNTKTLLALNKKAGKAFRKITGMDLNPLEEYGLMGYEIMILYVNAHLSGSIEFIEKELKDEKKRTKELKQLQE